MQDQEKLHLAGAAGLWGRREASKAERDKLRPREEGSMYQAEKLE